MKKHLLLFIGAFILILHGTVICATTEERDFGTIINISIKQQDLFEYVKILSSDEMNGRGTLKNGYDLPSTFLAKKLKLLGLTPLGDNGNTASPKQMERMYTQEVQGRSWFDGMTVHSRNVLGYIEGKKRDEIIVIGAHYDHLGNHGGDIYAGADDNASGTAAVLTIANTYAELRKQGIQPTRSILIVLWGAEEYGLIGSKYFVLHPPIEVPLKNIVTVINLDMVGRGKPNNYYCTSTPTEDTLSINCTPLYEVNERVSRECGLKPNYTYGFTRRSGDHASLFYALPKGKRIPILNYFTGLHEDYHKPTDTFEKIDYEKLMQMAQMAFLASWYISKLPERPLYRE